ncbi:MAG: type III pantothenate kinase [Flavobacteriales bacterium]
MHLCIDQGNTSTKIAFFSDRLTVHHAVLEDTTLLNDVAALVEKYNPEHVLLSTVRADYSALHHLLKQYAEVTVLVAETALPFAIDYESPQTLGADRKANAAAAISEFGRGNIVIVDCGTCITYTIVTDSILRGGAISPGIRMRLLALHQYTGRLPHLTPKNEVPAAIGSSTEGSIRAGVELATLLEVEKMTEQYCSEMTDPIVIFTGGASSYFVQHIKSRIFARPFLTLSGLHEILLHNLSL